MKFLAFTLALFFLALQARAQYIPITSIDSIETDVLNARGVAVGKISAFHVTDTGAVSATLLIVRTLKGLESSTLTVIQGWDPAQAHQFQIRGNRFLVINREGNSQVIMNLDAPNLLVSKSDFTLIRDPDELLAYIAATIKLNPGNRRIATVTLPVPSETDVGKSWQAAYLSRFYGERLSSLVVPVDDRLEDYARQELKSSSSAQRLDGIRLLKMFKAASNISVLKGLLDDPAYELRALAEFNNGVEVRSYPVRIAACECLRSLGATVPVIPEIEIPRFDTVEKVTWKGAVTDQVISRFKRLRELNFADQDLTDSNLSAIGLLKSLKSLAIRSSQTTNDGQLSRLSGLSELESLDLAACPISDKGVPALLRMGHLRDLSLRQTRVTDSGLKLLLQMSSLRRLDVAQSAVTYAAIDSVRKSRPNLTIVRNDVRLEPESPLYEDAKRGDLAGVRAEIAKSPNMRDVANSDGDTALICAVDNNRGAVAEFMLHDGAHVEYTNKAGDPPLERAAQRGELAIVRLLLEFHADPNQADRMSNTALHAAAHAGARDVVKRLLAAGANPALKNAAGKFPIDLVPKGDRETLKLLQEAKSKLPA